MPPKYYLADKVREEGRELLAEFADASEAGAMIENFSARLARKQPVLAWPTIRAALISQRHWITIACDSCDLVSDINLSFKRRPPDAPVSIVLAEFKCSRCNGHGRPRITALSKTPSL